MGDEYMIQFGFYGYLAAAVGYFVLLALLLTNWRGRLLGGILLVACATTMIWASVLAAYAYGMTFRSSLFWGVETLHSFVWLAFLSRLLNPMRGLREGFPRILAVSSSLLTILLLLPVDTDRLLRMLAPSLAGYTNIRYFGYLLLSLFGLILTEQLYRNTREDNRWGIKYLILGLGTIFAFDFYLYADALLFQRIDSGLWQARGPIVLMTAPLIGTSVARNPDWSIDVFISRKMAFHTATIVAAGIYTLLMGIAGYYIQLHGGEWGGVLQTIFFAGAILMLVVLTSSGHLRARAKVFLNKHFFKLRYDYREEWLRLIRTLSGQQTNIALFHRVISALAYIVESPGGYLFLLRPGGRVEMVDRYNAPEITLPHDVDYSRLVKLLTDKEWIVVLDQSHTEETSIVPDGLKNIDRAWLIAPLLHDAQLSGFVLLLAPKAPMQLNWENLDLLKTSGRQAASYLNLHQAAEALAEAKQFEGFNRLSAFVIHDLKNIIAQLSLLSRNAARHKSNPAFVDDAMATIENAVARMNRLLAQLNSGREESAEDGLNLVRAIREAVEAQSAYEPVPEFSSTESVLLVSGEKERMVSVISHLIQNAQDATPAEGRIRVSVERRGDSAVVIVADTGKGMSKDFIRDYLFKPFHTTKGLTGMGIGAYECKEFVQRLGGYIEVLSEEGKGTTFVLHIPLRAAAMEGDGAAGAKSDRTATRTQT